MAFTLNEEIFEPKFLFKIACQEWLDLVQKQKLTLPAQDIGLNDWKALKLGENERLTILSPPGYEAAQRFGSAVARAFATHPSGFGQSAAPELLGGVILLFLNLVLLGFK